MFNRFLLVFITVFVFAFLGCKKESAKSCWQKVDIYGNKLELVCNTTEAQMQALYPGGCGYYKAGGETFCWLVNGTTFIKNVTQEEINLYIRCFRGGSATVAKVACDYCGVWYHREKRTHKPSNTISYSQVKNETFCGDTAKTIFQGRQVIIRETADSLLVRQFSNNGTTW